MAKKKGTNKNNPATQNSAVSQIHTQTEEQNNIMKNEEVLSPAVSEEYEKAVKLTREKVTIHELINFDKEPPEPVKVSIVVPVCNVEQYLRECLDSCVNQTLKEIEIICVNDGSTDGCLNILKEYAAKDNRVKVIDKGNAGYGHTMNIGMDMAKGEYIGIVESDDFVELNMYEELYKVAKENDVDFIKADFNRFINIDGQKNFKYIKSANKGYYNKVIDPQSDIVVFKFNMQTWSGIYKNNFLKINCIRHNETEGASFQDNGFYYKTYCWAKKIYYIGRGFYNYRMDNPNSSVHNKGKTKAIKEEFDLIERYIKSHSLSDNNIGLFFWKKYKSFLFTIERIAYELKYDFFMDFSKEFKALVSDCTIKKEFFSEEEWSNLEWIINDPEDYYHLRVKQRKVTVIVPAYNVEDYVDESINSIIEQSLKDIEIICIDDGSTDRTYKKLLEFQKKDKRVQVFKQNNSGVGATRNKGIDLAHGEFLIFMDPDDFYPEKDVLEVLYNNAKKNNVLISGGSFSDYVDGSINTKYKGTLTDYVFDKDGIVEYKDYQFDYGFHRFIYNTEMIRNNSIYFPNYKRFQDPPFFIKAMNTAGKFYATSKIVYRYRRKKTPIAWTKEKLIDALNGVADDLKISGELGYAKLHSLSVQRLFITFKNPICKFINYDDLALLELLHYCNSLIKEELIIKDIVEFYRKDFVWTIIIREFININNSKKVRVSDNEILSSDVIVKKLKWNREHCIELEENLKNMQDKLNWLRNIKAEYEVKISVLENELKNYVNKNFKLKENSDYLHKKLDWNREQNAEFTIENKKLIEKLEWNRAQKAKLEDKVKTLENDLKTCRAFIAKKDTKSKMIKISDDECISEEAVVSKLCWNRERTKELEGKVKILEEKVKQSTEETTKLESEKEQLSNEITNMRNSMSMKIGRAFTWLPRKIKGK